jgi:hypothetical protein
MINIGLAEEKDLNKEQAEKLERAIAKCLHKQKVIAKPMYSKQPFANW